MFHKKKIYFLRCEEMGNHQNDEYIPLYLDIGPEHKASPVVATQLVVPTELSEVLYVQEVLSIFISDKRLGPNKQDFLSIQFA